GSEAGPNAQSDLPLPFSRAAAARHGSGLGGGRHSRRAHWRARLADGARSDPGNRRLRRGPGRAARHVRRPRHALRDAALRMGPGQSALGRASHDQGSIASRLTALWRRSHFVQVATAVVPFSTDHLLSPAVRTPKQICLAPLHLVQKPSLVSFHVPSPFAPPAPIGSRVILPSELNVIL